MAVTSILINMNHFRLLSTSVYSCYPKEYSILIGQNYCCSFHCGAKIVYFGIRQHEGVSRWNNKKEVRFKEDGEITVTTDQTSIERQCILLSMHCNQNAIERTKTTLTNILKEYIVFPWIDKTDAETEQ
jgi:hypothetical protein